MTTPRTYEEKALSCLDKADKALPDSYQLADYWVRRAQAYATLAAKSAVDHMEVINASV